MRCRSGTGVGGAEEPSALVVRVFEHRFEMLAQLFWVVVTVRRDGVLHCGVEHFRFGARNLQSAALLARIIPAIDRFTLCHNNLLSFSSVPPNLSAPDRCARLVSLPYKPWRFFLPD